MPDRGRALFTQQRSSRQEFRSFLGAGPVVRVLIPEAVVDQLRVSLVGKDADVAEGVPGLDPPTKVLAGGHQGPAPL